MCWLYQGIVRKNQAATSVTVTSTEAPMKTRRRAEGYGFLETSTRNAAATARMIAVKISATGTLSARHPAGEGSIARHTPSRAGAIHIANHTQHPRVSALIAEIARKGFRPERAAGDFAVQ